LAVDKLKLPAAVLGTALCLPLASPLAAQTTDPLFARWRWAPESLGSRPAGMGGAFVALADSVKSAYANPAGLTLIPINEIGFSSGRPWFGFGLGGGSRRFRLAGYAAKIDGTRVALDPSLGAGSSGSGFLESSSWESGLAVGSQVVRRLKVGAAVNWTAPSMNGERRNVDAGGGETVTTFHGDGGQINFTVGALLELLNVDVKQLPSVRLGISYRRGFDWSGQIENASDLGPGARSIDIRRPSVISTGLGWRFTDRWSFALQGDIIRNREVLETLRRNVGDRASGFLLSDQVEPRFGTEWSWPIPCGCGVMKFRGGLRYESSGRLRYGGTDAVIAAAFPDEPGRTVTSLGASFFTEYFGRALRLDVDSKDVLRGPDLSFGIVWRF